MNGKCILASEQQILKKIGTTSHRNVRNFCPLLGTVHYWGLLLNKNGWEAGFCPLLGAFPLLGSALLGEYSVLEDWSCLLKKPLTHPEIL